MAGVDVVSAVDVLPVDAQTHSGQKLGDSEIEEFLFNYRIAKCIANNKNLEKIIKTICKFNSIKLDDKNRKPWLIKK